MNRPKRHLASTFSNPCDNKRQFRAMSSIQRFTSVKGLENRVNDVVYSAGNSDSSSSNAIIFFGGDVQDFPENMSSHRDHGRFIDFNLEAIAQRITRSCRSQVLVVRPSRLNLKTFSCYSNFVPCDNIGSPSHEPNNEALEHLAALLKSVDERISPVERTRLDDCNLTLIGFSKGCVVLNQFCHEIHTFHTLPSDKSIVKKINKMIWLDGGHSGGKETWITSRSMLETLSKTGIEFEVHVTPYQVRDNSRPWIGQEEKLFCSTLKRLGANLNRTIHMVEELPSLENHFHLLNIVFPIE